MGRRMCHDGPVSNSIVTGEAVVLDIRAASLAARAISCAIDAIVYVAVYVGVFIAAAWALDQLLFIDELLARTAIILLTVLTLVLVPCTIEVLTRGRSLGKLVCGLRIVRDDGGAIAFRHAFLRALLWQFEVLATGGGVAAFVGLLSPQSKRLGDYLAGTVAVNERAAIPRSALIGVPQHLVPWISRADVSALPSGLHYRMVQFLATAGQRAPESRLERAIELAEEVNPFVAPAPPEGTHPEDFLAAIVGHLRWEHSQRMARAARTTAEFRGRVGTLPHGLRL
jgi:uncharacterized RDD family membrane protein YckC